MANSWLRLYHDMPNDPKWRTIARAAKQTIPVVLAVYVHLLTIASGAVERGTLVNVNSEDLASALDVDSEAVDAVLEAMQGRVLDGDKLSGWEKRQANREDGAAERAKAWREAKKAERKRTEANAENGSRTQTNAAERKRTPDKKREEEIQKEQKPSRDKREANPKHTVFKGIVADAWKEWGNPLDMPWDGAEGKHLGMLIGANPNLGPDGMRRLLQYRARSNGVNLVERPSKWLRSLTDYARGPLNEFKQPQETSNGNRNQSKTGGNLNAAAQAIAFLEQEERNRETADDSEFAETSGSEPGDAGAVCIGSGASGTGGRGHGAEGAVIEATR